MKTSVFLFHLLELLAALAASYYWLRTKDKTVKPFVWYLWLVVFIETLAMYTYLYDIMDNSFIRAIQNSKIERNSWLYNLFALIEIILIGNFLILNTKQRISHVLIRIISFGFVFFSVVFFVWKNSFFEFHVPYHTIITTFTIFIMVMIYLRELIRDSEILNFYKSPVFFVLIALLLWYICLTPLFLFNSFYMSINEEFVEFRRIFLDTSNIILYSWYIFAFLYPLRYKMKLVLN